MRRSWLILSVVVAACASRTTPRAVSGAEWVAVDTPHIHLETDLPRRYATLRAKTLERELLTQIHLYQLLSPKPAPALEPTHVVLFDDCESFKSVGLGGETRAGYARRSFDLDDVLVVVTCDDNVSTAGRAEQFRNRLFRHELAHVLNHHFFGDLPLWLNEGIAEYFEASRRLDDGRVELGHPPWYAFSYDHADERAMTFDDLRAHDWSEKDRPYHAAWKATYALLNTSMASRAHTMRFLAEVAAGASEPEAWSRALAAVEPDVRKTYAEWKPLSHYNIWTATVPAAPAFDVRVRAMPPAEVAARVVELAMYTSDETTLSPALRDALDNLRQRDTAGATASLWTALAAYYTKHPALGDAKTLLDAHVVKYPDDPRAQLGRFLVALASLDKLSADERARVLAELAPAVTQLVPVARTPYALNALARYQLAVGNRPAAVPFLRRALARDPACSGCYETLGYLLFLNGELADAVRAQQLAIGALGDRNPDPGMLSRLERYRAAAAGASEGP